MEEDRCWNDLAAENARLKASLEALSKAHLTACQSVVSERQHSALLEAENAKMRAAIGETHTQTPFDREGAPK